VKEDNEAQVEKQWSSYPSPIPNNGITQVPMKTPSHTIVENYVVDFAYNACIIYESVRSKIPLYVTTLFKMQASDHDMLWLPKTCCYLFMYKILVHRKRVRLKSSLLKKLWCAPYALIDYLV
jgi:hypothetical protein